MFLELVFREHDGGIPEAVSILDEKPLLPATELRQRHLNIAKCCGCAVPLNLYCRQHWSPISLVYIACRGTTESTQQVLAHVRTGTSSKPKNMVGMETLDTELTEVWTCGQCLS